MEIRNNLPTIESITNLYLYNQDNSPTEERLDSKLINNGIRRLEADVNLFMNEQVGPGRFITAADFPFIGIFLSPDTYIRTDPYVDNDPTSPYSLDKMIRLTSLERNRRYTKSEIVDMIKYGGASQTLGFYDDGGDSVLERAYIGNTTAFKISNNAKFCIDENGHRFIKDFPVTLHKEKRY